MCVILCFFSLLFDTVLSRVLHFCGVYSLAFIFLTQVDSDTEVETSDVCDARVFILI